MANTTCKNCGVAITWADVAGKWVPLVDGVRHRCEAWSATYSPDWRDAPAPLPYSTPPERTELQELRHAVQRLSRACELLYEAVDAMAARELASGGERARTETPATRGQSTSAAR